MVDISHRMNDPVFRRHLQVRKRWRWGLSGFLIALYMTYGVCGVYMKQAYAQPFPGTAIPWGLMIGYLIIGLSILFSLVYVRVANRLEDAMSGEDGS